MEMNSFNACPVFDLDAIYQFITKYAILFGLIFMALGLFVNFFGRKMIKPTVFIIGCVMTAMICAFILYALFLQSDHADWLNWFMLVICILLGLLVGYLLVRFLKYGIGILGGGAGFAVGLLICTIAKVQQEWLFLVIVIALALICTLITFKASDHVMIGSTALIGSYAIIRGFSMIAGGYINEFTLAKEI